MEERELLCSFITPMFSYGAYRKIPEFRTAQVKGMMRYVYRIVCPWQTLILKKNEGTLFGEATDGTGHASPVRLVAAGGGRREENSMPLLLHDEKKGVNPPMKFLKEGTVLLSVKVKSGLGEEKSVIHEGADVDWYADLAILSLTLCGLGRRSRKGRGAIAVEKVKNMDLEQAKTWILDTLNRTAGMLSDRKGEPFYVFSDGGIKPDFNTEEIRRPVIQKVWFGNRLSQGQVIDFLKTVDKLCHDKLEKGWTDGAKATGYVTREKRLASPLWISFIQVKDGIYPVYTYVKAYEKTKELDARCIDRDAFVARLENKKERR